jgi:molybdate transport system substrate-binding protein
VYVTDVKAAGAKVVGIPIPDGVNASTEYPIATVTRSANPELAKAFEDYVLSPEGAAVIEAAGFGKP